MICRYCAGHVTWRGPLSHLTHTECQDCGRTNCQEVAADHVFEDDEDTQLPIDRDMGDS